MHDVFVHRAPKMPLAQRNDSVEAFFLDGSHKSLGMGVRIRRAIRRLDDPNAGLRSTSWNGPLHFVSRSQISTRQISASAIVSVRPTWRMKASSSCSVGPRIWTRRDARWMTKTVYMVTEPRHVHTSVVKKSAPVIPSLWARRNVCHDVGRSGTGGRPCALRIRAIVDRPTRCPTFFSAPWIRV
jgi:hypothetical protein